MPMVVAPNQKTLAAGPYGLPAMMGETAKGLCLFAVVHAELPEFPAYQDWMIPTMDYRAEDYDIGIVNRLMTLAGLLRAVSATQTCHLRLAVLAHSTLEMAIPACMHRWHAPI
jgi:hypothetical protein